MRKLKHFSKKDKELFKIQEGKNLIIDKEILDDQRTLEVSTEVSEKAKVSNDDKTDYETFKVIYKGAIDDKCLEDYGTIDDKKLWEDTAKEMFLASVEMIPEEDKKADGELEKKAESKKLNEEQSESTDNDFSSLEFEKLIPHKMRWKEWDIVNDNELYWVTQEFFSEAELKEFAEAFKNYSKLQKAYITVRDFSSYIFKDDVADGVLAIVNKDGTYDLDGYGETCIEEGFEDDLALLDDENFERTFKVETPFGVIDVKAKSPEDAVEKVKSQMADSSKDKIKIAESVKQDLLDANIEDLTTGDGEDWIVFYLGDKELASYTFSGTFDGELPETREALAKENGVKPEDIKVKAITKKIESVVSDYTLNEIQKVLDSEETEYGYSLKITNSGSDAETKTLDLDKEDLQAIYNALSKNKVTENKKLQEVDSEELNDVLNYLKEIQTNTENAYDNWVSISDGIREILDAQFNENATISYCLRWLGQAVDDLVDDWDNVKEDLSTRMDESKKGKCSRQVKECSRQNKN